MEKLLFIIFILLGYNMVVLSILNKKQLDERLKTIHIKLNNKATSINEIFNYIDELKALKDTAHMISLDYILKINLLINYANQKVIAGTEQTIITVEQEPLID